MAPLIDFCSEELSVYESRSAGNMLVGSFFESIVVSDNEGLSDGGESTTCVGSDSEAGTGIEFGMMLLSFSGLWMLSLWG